jgi:hypothetical protein
MEAGIDLGFTALIAAAVSGGQHRDRASRPQKELYWDIVELLLKTSKYVLRARLAELLHNCSQKEER